MTPARSLAASVVALGFAGSLTASLPATAAPAPCERAENFAAQSGAELLRIERLEVRPSGAGRPVTKPAPVESEPTGATDRVLGGDASPLDPTDSIGDEDGDTLSEGIGDAGVAVIDSLLPGGVDTLTNSPSLLGSNDLTSGTPLAAAGEDTGGVGGGSVMSADAESSGIARQSGGSRQADNRGQAGERGQAVDGGTAGTRGVTGAPGSSDAGEPGLTSKPGRAGEPGLTSEPGRAGEPDGDGDGESAGDGGPGVSPRGGSRAAVLRGVGLGESRAALVGTADVKSAAVARILDAADDGKDAWTKPIVQQAPPSHARPATRETPASRFGPLRVGAGEVSAHARWDAGMACGSTAGEAARSVAELRGASLLGGGNEALVRVPEKVTSRSTTALERRGETPRSVAATTVTAGRIDLAGGQVRLRVLRAPALVAEMSAQGGAVHYRPALIEVSGPDIATKRLAAAGDHVDVTLDRQTTEAGVAGIAGLGDLRPGSPLPLPAIPGLPRIAPVIPEPPLESATTGTKLRISLGGSRQAEKGHAIAARATAIRLSVTEGGAKDSRSKGGYAGGSSLDLSLGLMEAAAVAPETADVNGDSGTAGGLPITGPRAGGLVIGGVALLVAGIAAVALSVRRRRSRP